MFYNGKIFINAVDSKIFLFSKNKADSINVIKSKRFDADRWRSYNGVENAFLEKSEINNYVKDEKIIYYLSESKSDKRFGRRKELYCINDSIFLFIDKYGFKGLYSYGNIIIMKDTLLVLQRKEIGLTPFFKKIIKDNYNLDQDSYKIFSIENDRIYFINESLIPFKVPQLVQASTCAHGK